MVTFTDGTTAGVSVKDIIPALSKKIIEVTVPATFVWGTDLIVVDLNDYGCSTISGFLAFEETTASSIVIPGTGTTSVAAGVLTFNSTGSTATTCGGTLIVFANK